MKKAGILVALAGAIVLTSTALLSGGKNVTPPADDTFWPTKGWATDPEDDPVTARCFS